MALKLISRKKQQIQQKFGSSDKNVDLEFETHRDNWDNMQKSITAIDKELKNNESWKVFMCP